MSFVGPLGWTLRPFAPYHVRRVAVGVSGTSESTLISNSQDKINTLF